MTASKGGAPTHPAWYYNLLADPTATIELDLQTIKVRASVAEGAERQRLWDQHVAIHTGIGEYPRKTDRVIPVVVLERRRRDRSSIALAATARLRIASWPMPSRPRSSALSDSQWPDGIPVLPDIRIDV